MKILIYGAGIQGNYLAHSLNKNKKNDITLLARGKNKQSIDQYGVKLNHTIQHKITVDHFKTIETLEKNDYYDLIFVTMKYSDFNSIVEPISRNNSAVVVFVGNQMDTEALKLSILEKNPNKTVLFGFQNTGGVRKDEVIKILRINGGNMKIDITKNRSKITTLLDNVFQKTHYRWIAKPQLDNWLKSHAALIMVLNSLDYIYGNDASKIKADKSMLNITSKAFNEAFKILEDNGYPITPKTQRILFGNPKIAKAILKVVYSLPIMNSVQGNFREISSISKSFIKFKNKSQTRTPNLDILLSTAETRED
ncbi:ketopantoate reductase family protein [Pediococcus argentinicus]|nr:2-dehydropantoate 2-reductase N-terminal domain-containing protein [Pediococcus argentinicus]NKZ21763.1 hypothetical protein [Pediococcus argentinicus]GEP18979.1 2-dehydropantoate 2-reductase [Pediococcus argentinicus]